MGREYCAVYGCSSTKRNGVSLHHFPRPSEFITIADGLEKRKVNRRQLWEHRLRMGKRTPKNALVCSKHFQSEDFFVKSLGGGRSMLKKNSVPSRNLPKSSLCTSSRKSHRKSPPKGLEREKSKECRNLIKSLDSESFGEQMSPVPEQVHGSGALDGNTLWMLIEAAEVIESGVTEGKQPCGTTQRNL